MIFNAIYVCILLYVGCCSAYQQRTKRVYKMKNLVDIYYTTFTQNQTTVILSKMENPLRAQYTFLGSQFINGSLMNRTVVFKEVPMGFYYQFKEIIYDSDGVIVWILQYEDYGFMPLPLVELVSTENKSSLGVKFEFSQPEVSSYMWRLIDNSGGPDDKKVVCAGTVDKKNQKQTEAEAEVAPVAVNTEYIFQYYAIKPIYTEPPHKLIVGMNMVRIFVDDPTPIAMIVTLTLILLMAIAVRVNIEVKLRRRGLRYEGPFSKKRGRENKGGDGTLQNGVRLWKTYRQLSSLSVATNKFENYAFRQTESTLSSHYQQLTKTVKPGATKDIAEHPENSARNRWSNVVSYDHSQFMLDEDCAGPLPRDKEPPTYINASWIPGENDEKEYIATQGPKKGYLLDFWTMVWQTKSRTIIMLTNLREPSPGDREGGKMMEKCARYWPDKRRHHTTLKLTPNFKVENQGEENLGTCGVIRSLKVTQMEEELLVKQFHFTVWPDHGVPKNFDECVLFLKATREHAHKFPLSTPRIVHCSAGAGRTGCYIVLSRVLDQLERKATQMDIKRLVGELRYNRMEMVQTSSQYKFIHDMTAFLINKMN